MQAMPPLLAGRKVAVLGSARGLGRAVAAACEGAGAEVLGIDSEAVFDHVSAFYRFDAGDPLAMDAVAAALPEGLDGLALLPQGGLGAALAAPKRLAGLIAPRMAQGGAIVAQAAPVTGDWPASLGLIRAAAALRPGDEAAFADRWHLAQEPALESRAIGWGMLAFVLAHHARWPGIRLNALSTDPLADPHPAALAAVFLLGPLSAALNGAHLAADGGRSARIQTSLDGL
jgi:hypothetical protein